MQKRVVRSRALACIIMGWLFVLGSVAHFVSVDAPLPRGILDGDDDDGAVSSVWHTGPEFVALVPVQPQVLSPSRRGIALVPVEQLAFSIPVYTVLSRSPPPP